MHRPGRHRPDQVVAFTGMRTDDCAASVFLLGDAIGHVRQMVISGNFAPGNAGLPFYIDVVCPLLAIALIFVSTADAHKLKSIRSDLVVRFQHLHPVAAGGSCKC